MKSRIWKIQGRWSIRGDHHAGPPAYPSQTHNIQNTLFFITVLLFSLISSSTTYTIIIRPLLDLEMFYSTQHTKRVLSSDEILWVKVKLDHLKLHQHDDDKDYNDDEGKKEVFECVNMHQAQYRPSITHTIRLCVANILSSVLMCCTTSLLELWVYRLKG